MEKYDFVEHDVLTYVYNIQHIIASKSNETLKEYIQDMHNMVIELYKHSSLHINGDKTEFINFDESHKDMDAKFSITDKKGTIIRQKDTIKVL